jgi:hypothetical protein
VVRDLPADQPEDGEAQHALPMSDKRLQQSVQQVMQLKRSFQKAHWRQTLHLRALQPQVFTTGEPQETFASHSQDRRYPTWLLWRPISFSHPLEV